MDTKKSGAIRAISRALRSGDSGISIIEVMVAALIFMVISIGIAQATVNSIRLAGDQRHRVTALSLAASEIDLVRAMGDPFSVLTRDVPLVTVIDGISYRTYRDTEWVSGTGTDIPCGGTGTANLQLKRVNVKVEWTGQIMATRAVITNTVLAPDGRINDATKGSIVVAVKQSGGVGASGIDVTVTPVSGGATALAAQPPDTNAEGCSYALKIVPGVYDVTVSKTGWVGEDFATAPVRRVTVAAGATSQAEVIYYDLASIFNVTYAPGAPVGTKFPTDLGVSYVGGGGNGKPVTVVGTPSSVKAYPGDEYLVVAGTYVSPAQSNGCASLDPSEWSASTWGAVNLGDGSHGDLIGAPSGATTAISVRMGIATVRTGASGGDWYITAVSTTPVAGSGDPGCGTAGTASAIVYKFGQVLKRNTDTQIALPFGSWKLYYGTTAGAITTPFTTITTYSNAAPGMVSGNTVTLDPRPLS